VRRTFCPPKFRLSTRTPFGPTLSILVLTVALNSVAQDFSYRNPNFPIDQRVSRLLKQMTLEETVDQLMGGRHAMHLDDPESKQAIEQLRQLWDVNSNVTPRERAHIHNAAQKALVERTRLGIPALFQGEALHGFMANMSTSFPQLLGLASTWDPDLVRQVFIAASDEMPLLERGRRLLRCWTWRAILAGDEPRKPKGKIHT
jgi:beta-glucosidase